MTNLARPYRGLEPLDTQDAAVFFGRDAEILQGLDKLRGMRTAGNEWLFVILGPSGSGKSSFLRAGLLPRLARNDRHFIYWKLSVRNAARYLESGDWLKRFPRQTINCGSSQSISAKIKTMLESEGAECASGNYCSNIQNAARNKLAWVT